MIAPGAKGSFPRSTEDATKLTSIIPLSNPHTRTTGFQGTRMYMADLRGQERLTITTIILRKSHPLQAMLAQAEEIRTRRDVGELDVSPQNHNVIFELSRGTRAEKFSSTRI